MKKFTLTSSFVVALAFVAVSAFAGPVAMEKNVAPMPPPCSWTGVYIGVNAGGTDFNSRVTDVNDWYDLFSREYDSPAFIGGGQVGYNYQWDQLVLGIEADFSGSNAYTRSVNNEGNDVDGHLDETKIDFMGTLRGRMGISFNDNKALVYVTGGGAYAHGLWDTKYYNNFNTGSFEADWKGDDWRWGWVGGMGLQYALNCHWSIRAEGLFTWLEQNTVHMTGGPAAATESYYRFRFNDSLWTYRVGVDYKFNGFFGH